MFESFSRGFRMIWASIKMGWQDKRLLIPSVLTVFTNVMFGCIFFLGGLKQWAGKMKGAVDHGNALHNGHGAAGASLFGSSPTATQATSMPTHGLLGGSPDAGFTLMNSTQLNGSGDMSGLQALNWDTLHQFLNPDNMIIGAALMTIWWLTNRFLEGVTTGLVYSHLTEGKGTGKFSEACNAVLQSLPAIIMLGLATLIIKKIAGFLKDKNHTGLLGTGFNFLAGIVEVFWTLAGHLILPAIVIEGCSFWGALKRADKIAQGSLLTIGVGEVGVDLICRLSTWMIWGGGFMGFGAAYYTKALLSPPMFIAAGIWVASLVLVTALSIYIRAAFYTCLYVWAIEVEDLEEAERAEVKAPGPLAAALA